MPVVLLVTNLGGDKFIHFDFAVFAAITFTKTAAVSEI